MKINLNSTSTPMSNIYCNNVSFLLKGMKSNQIKDVKERLPVDAQSVTAGFHIKGTATG